MSNKELEIVKEYLEEQLARFEKELEEEMKKMVKLMCLSNELPERDKRNYLRLFNIENHLKSEISEIDYQLGLE